MTDSEIISRMASMCTFYHHMNGDDCVFLSFFDEKDCLGGTIRRHPMRREIFDLVAQLPNLKHLNLRKCKIGAMPKMATRSLEWLDLASNDLPEVPDWVALQPKLGFLSLGSNNLSEVPDLSALTMLRTLKLHKNRIHKMPQIPKDIASLNLYFNPLDGIPDVIQTLWNLEIFVFGMANAKKLPSFEKLPRLKWLILSSSQIEEVPEDICTLSRLESLILAKNCIKSVPEKIGELKNLKWLSFYCNEIVNLPESLFTLKLQQFNIYNNPLSNKEHIINAFSNIEYLKV